MCGDSKYNKRNDQTGNQRPARRWRLSAVVAFVFFVASVEAVKAVESPIFSTGINEAEFLAVGSVAPSFTLADTTGKNTSLTDFAGKLVLLNFWSCYTDTCITPVNVLNDLLARFGPLGLVAPTVCEEVPSTLAGDNYAGLRQFCGTGQQILLDPRHAVRDLYQVRQLPTSILIGPDLKVLEVARGLQSLCDPALHKRIENLVRSTAPASDPR